MTDEELRAEGVEDSLIEYRKKINETIASGHKYIFDFVPQRRIEIARAFISNPFGYDRVFLLGVNDEKIAVWDKLVE